MQTTKMAGRTAESPKSETSSPGPLPVESLHDMESGALQELLEQATKASDTLNKEIEMFEKFLKRLDPKDVQFKAVPATPSSQLDLRSQWKKAKTKKEAVTERSLSLTVEQKFDIATRELDELREQLEKQKDDFERAFDNHRGVVAEADLRLAETKKLGYEFDRDIIRGAVNPRTGQLLGEKVVRFFEDRLRAQDSLIEKLKLKNSTLRVKKRRLQVALKQKEEAGEVRHEVDFEQLKIENKQFSERYDEKIQELLQLKLSAGNTMQVLNSYKKRLHTMSLESRQLDSEIAQRKQLLDKIEAEATTVTREKEKAEEINAQARRKLEDYRVPDVMEYVRERASLHELTKTVRAWERKVEIAEMALRTYRQTWRRLCQQTRQTVLDPLQTALY